jgi:hypothetical protein
MKILSKPDLIGATIVDVIYDTFIDDGEITEIIIKLKDGREATILGTNNEQLCVENW